MRSGKRKIRAPLPKGIGSFTLIEVLVVAMLTSFLAFKLLGGAGRQLQKTRDVERKADVHAVRGALEDYFDDAGCYPDTLPQCGSSLRLGETEYLSAVPCDPTSDALYRYVVQDGTCPSSYQLYANLENTSDTAIDAVACRGGCGPDCAYNYGLSSSNIGLSLCESAPSAVPTVQGPTATLVPSPTHEVIPSPTQIAPPTATPTPQPPLFARSVPSLLPGPGGLCGCGVSSAGC